MQRQNRLAGFLLPAVCWFWGTAVAFGAAAGDATCLGCHAEKEALHASIHGSLGCGDCHTTIRAFPHPEHVAPVNCSTCHTTEGSGVSSSVHAHSSQQPCLSCHGDAHGILAAKDPKSPVYALNLPRTCGTCHGNQDFVKKHGLPDVYSEYIDSIHGFALTKDGLLVAATCSSCHGAHDILTKKDPKSRTNRANIPATCGACHQGIETAYFAGVHGKALKAGNPAVPACQNCHTAHQIADVREAAWKMKTAATCGGCHKEKFQTYRDTLHAQVSSLGYVETAHCWDCHRAHDILPKSDPASSVAQAHLVETCGKCHSGIGASFVSYEPHADPHNAQAYPALHASAVFMNLLLASVLGFFILHTILWFIRSRGGNPS